MSIGGGPSGAGGQRPSASGASAVSGAAANRDALKTTIMRAAGILFVYGSTTITARVLGDLQFGEYHSALGLAMLLAALAPLGTDRVLVRNLSVRDDVQQQRHEVIITHRCLLLAMLALLALVIPSGLVLGRLGFPEWQKTVLLSGLLFPPLGLLWLRQWVALPLVGSFQALVPEQILIPLGLVTGLLAIRAGGGAAGAVEMALLHAGLMVCLWLATTRSRHLQAVYGGLLRQVVSELRPAELRQYAAGGLPFLLVAIGGILCQRSMPLVVAAGTDFAAVAAFSYGMMVAGAATLPLGVLNIALVPRFARLWQNRLLQDADRLARDSAAIIFFAGAFFATLIWLCWPVLLVFIGPDYAPVTALLPWLLAAVLLDCLTGPTVPVMQTMGLERDYGRLLLLHTPIQLGLMYWCSVEWSLLGAAAAYLIGRGLWNVAIFSLIARRRGMVLLPALDSIQRGIAVLRMRSELRTAGCGGDTEMTAPENRAA